MEELLYKQTHIGRTIDPRYPTNLAIIIWSFLVAVVIFAFRLVSGTELVQAGINAFVASLSVFYVWALSREIDPDEQLSAFVSVALMTIALFVVEVRFNLIVLFYLMSMSRIINRISGLPAKWSDSIVLLLFTGYVGLWGGWLCALIGAVAFLLDSLLPNPDRKHIFFAGLALIVMVVALLMQNQEINLLSPSIDYLILSIGATIIFVPHIIKSRTITTRADITGETLNSTRVQATQVFLVLVGFGIAFWKGDVGVLEFLPLWIAIAGVSLFPLLKPLMPNWDLSRRS